MSHQQESDEVPEGEQRLCAGLARELAGSESDRESVVYYEEKTKERPQHHVSAAPHRRHQEDVGLGPAHQPDEEAVPLHAQEAGAVHQEWRPDDKVLSTQLSSVHVWLKLLKKRDKKPCYQNKTSSLMPFFLFHVVR